MSTVARSTWYFFIQWTNSKRSSSKRNITEIIFIIWSNQTKMSVEDKRFFERFTDFLWLSRKVIFQYINGRLFGELLLGWVRLVPGLGFKPRDASRRSSSILPIERHNNIFAHLFNKCRKHVSFQNCFQINFSIRDRFDRRIMERIFLLNWKQFDQWSSNNYRRKFNQKIQRDVDFFFSLTSLWIWSFVSHSWAFTVRHNSSWLMCDDDYLFFLLFVWFILGFSIIFR